MVNIFGINIEENLDYINVPSLLRYVSPDKQHRINAFRNHRDAQRVLIGDLLIRSIACRHLKLRNDELDFRTNEYGKPYLVGIDDFHYNLSHSGRWVVCVVDTKPIGIDIEEIVPVEMDIIYNYFSHEEINYLKETSLEKKKEVFYDIWTLKESYIKALGYGLSEELNSFTIEMYGDSKVKVKEAYNYSPVFLRKYEIDWEHRLSVCALNDDFPNNINIVDMCWILNGLISDRKAN